MLGQRDAPRQRDVPTIIIITNNLNQHVFTTVHKIVPRSAIVKDAADYPAEPMVK